MKLFRTNVLALALAGAVLVPTLSGAASGATLDKQAPKVGVALNAKAMVDADIVTLGDLFDGVGEKAETPVAYAPRPGKRAYFGARWLYRLARAHNLSWRPLSKHTQAVVERRGQVIDREEIKDAILGAMRARGVDADLEVGLTNAMIRMHVPANAPATVSVDEISYDNHSKRFAALLSAPADDPNAQRLRVAGHMVAMTEVPVVNRRVAKGDVIAEADIAWKKIRTDRLRRDTVTRPENLIGKSPIRGPSGRLRDPFGGSPPPALDQKGRSRHHRFAGSGHAVDRPGQGAGTWVGRRQHQSQQRAVVASDRRDGCFRRKSDRFHRRSNGHGAVSGEKADGKQLPRPAVYRAEVFGF